MKLRDKDISEIIIASQQDDSIVEWNGKTRKGICPKCFGFGTLQKHHIFPKRFFPKNGKVLYLCHACHSSVERILPRRKLTKKEYIQIHKSWIVGKSIIVK